MAWFDDTYSRVCVPVLMDLLGESEIVLYQDGSSVVELRGIVTNEAIREEEDVHGIRKRRECELIVTRDPDGTYGGLERVKLKATVDLRGERWAVEQVTGQSSSTVTIALVQYPRTQKSAQNFKEIA